MVAYEHALRSMVKIPGDVIEIGVFTGRNSMIFCDHLQQDGDWMYFGFDTFTGYMEDDITNDVSEQNKAALQRMQDSKRWHFSKQKVENSIEMAGYQNFKLIEGDVKQTLKPFLEENPLNISLLYIDCNAYVPALHSMEACYPYMGEGSVIAIDEHQIGGEHAALLEFTQKYNLEIIETGWKYPDGPPQYVVIK